MLIALLGGTRLLASPEVNAADFGMVPGEDATFALRKALEACHERGAKRLVVPPGRYLMSPGFAVDFSCTPSNHDAGVQRVGMLLDGFDGLTIDAPGVQLIFSKPMVPLVIKGSRDITVRGLTIDWDRLLAFQGTVVAVDPASNSYDLEVHPDCIAFVHEGILLHGEEPEEANHHWPRSQDLTWGRWFDPVAGNWLQGNPYTGEHGYRAWNPEKNVFARAENLGNGRFRLYDSATVLPKVGWTLMAKGMRTPNRRSPAIWIAESERTRLEGVTIHHAGGMGVIGEQSRDILLQGLRVVPRPDSGRLFSTSADATHFSSCAGLIELADCELTAMGDDGTNVHGIYLVAESRPSPRQVIGRIGHFQHAGNRFAVPGDRVRLVASPELNPIQTATVAAVEHLNTHRLLLTFDEDVVADVAENVVIENLSWTPDVHIHGCTFQRNVARSLLIHTPGRVVIEDNQFLDPSEFNLGGSPGTGFWYESGSLQNVVIRRNTFSVASAEPTINIGGAPRNLPVGYHRNIVIEDNEIRTQGGVFLRLKGVDGFTFRGNRIVSSAPTGTELGVVLENCRAGEVTNNRVQGDHRYRVGLRGATTDIHVSSDGPFELPSQR